MEDGIAWRCVQCRGRLEAGWDCWRCCGCGAQFRALRGIPDLRTADDLYLSNHEDWAIAMALNEEFDALGFRELLDRYFAHCPEIPEELRQRQITHILTAPGRVRHWLGALGGVPDGRALDLGCGTGSFLAAVGKEWSGFCGVDIAMRWLIVARKRLDEEGLAKIPLICACGEALPLGDGCLAAIVAGDVIEHVNSQEETLAEAYRVLKPGGRLFMASPNRYSLAPEPHVQVWGVGYLPRMWMRRYVWLWRKVDFRAIRTLGYGEWMRLLRKSPFKTGIVTVPCLPDDDLKQFSRLKRWVGRCYNALVARRLGQWVGRSIGPLFHVVCEKSASS